jgi:chitinase
MNSVALSFVLLATVYLSSANAWKKGTPELQAKTFNLHNQTNFVVYWGSTDNEGALSDHCNDSIYDVIILAFAAVLNEDGVPQLYLDECDGQNCSRLISQVQSCQNNGKTIMLSVGGGAGYYILKSDDYAKKVATHLWNMFLNGSGEDRPFGNGVVLDGVDFDIEAGTKESNPYWVTLINELRTLTKADTSKHYYLSGAPQCVLPDAWSVAFTRSSKYSFSWTIYSFRFGPGPQTAISEADLDFISIQFYNNYCGVQSFFRI